MLALGASTSNPGDREFRDTVRKLHKNTPSNSNYKNQRTNPGEKPYSSPFRPPRSRDQSPSTNEPSCAWCSANGRPHVHATSDCAMLKNANALDQWKIIYRNQLCDKCLTKGHGWRECSIRNPRCPTCNATHHPDISCRPQERISPNYPQQYSTYPDAS